MYLTENDIGNLLNALAEQPVDQGSLWIACWGNAGQPGEPIPASISRIARDMKEAKHSRTILVHGRYGSGKSSFMKSLYAQVEKDVIPLWIDMPALMSNIDSTALPAVMIRIAETLQEKSADVPQQDCGFGQALEDLWRIEARAMRTECRGPCETTIPPEPNRMASTVRSEGHRSVMANTLEQRFAQCIKSLGKSSGELEVVFPMVVFLDDLDRCERRVAMDVVRLLLRFGSVSNVHFVLSCDWDVLEQGAKDWMRQHGKADDDVPLVTANSALEKYIHIPVELPGMGAYAAAWEGEGGGFPDVMRKLLELRSGLVRDEQYRQARLCDVLVNDLLRKALPHDEH